VACRLLSSTSWSVLMHSRRHDGPIVGVAVDAWNLVGGELKDLERDIRPVERSHRVAGENEEDHQGQAKQMGSAVQQWGTEIFHGGKGCSPDRKNESQSKRPTQSPISILHFLPDSQSVSRVDLSAFVVNQIRDSFAQFCGQPNSGLDHHR